MSLKEEFKAAYEAAKPRIDKALKKAETALDEAKKISEETGVPFESYIVDNTSDTFVPSSMLKKFPGIDSTSDDEDSDDEESILAEIAGLYDYDGYGYGAGFQKSYC